MENRRRRAGNRRHNPRPFGLRLTAGALLAFAKLDELTRRLMVIDESHAFLLERPQHRLIELNERMVAPQIARLAGIEAKLFGNDRQLVVARHIAKIAGTNFRAHVPTVEWRAGVNFRTSRKDHVGNRRHRVPLETQLAKPLVTRMADCHLAYQLRRQIVNAQRLAALNDQWQKIKSRRARQRPPAERQCHPRELEVHRITENAAIGRLVRSVSDELVAPNADLIFRAAPWRHHRHQWRDPPIAGRAFQMLAGGLENFVGRGELAGIDHLQRFPMQPTDAAHGIAPRLTARLLQRDIRRSGGLEQLRRIDEVPTLGMMAMQRASGSRRRVRVIHDRITAPVTRRNGFREKRETPGWQAERTPLRCAQKT